MITGKLALLLGASVLLTACANQGENRNAAKARDNLDEQQRQQQLQQAEQRCGSREAGSSADRRLLSDCDVDALGRTLDNSLRPIGGVTAPLGPATQSLSGTRGLGL